MGRRRPERIRVRRARVSSGSSVSGERDLLEAALQQEYDAVREGTVETGEAAKGAATPGAADAAAAAQISRFVFVECNNEPAVDEARWALSLAESSESRCAAVVAHIPAFDGADAVRAFLDALRTDDGRLPSALKGGRVVMLGNPMPAPDHCLTHDGFDASLSVLEAEGLHWEWCCHHTALPSIAKVCAAHPE